MKRELAVMCALTACSAAYAQTNVTMYGNIDQYIGYIKSSSGKSITGLNDGAVLRSRIGLRGAEDLGNDFAATFQLEGGFAADSGALADTSRLFDRQAWVGLKNPYGEFRIGRQNGPVFYIGGAIDYTDRTTFGSLINTFGVPSRFDNDISFKTKRIANFEFDLHYAMPEIAGESIGKRGVFQFGADYTNGPYRAGYAGLWAKPLATATIADKVVYHNVYANYDYGNGKLYFAAVRSNNITAGANGNTAASILSNVGNAPAAGIPGSSFAGTNADVQRMYNIYQISADYRVSPQLRVGALYGVIRDTSGGDAGASGGNFGAYYSLSKRTTLYGFANYMKNDSNGGFRFSGSAGPSANLAGADINGKSLIGLQAGVLHRF